MHKLTISFLAAFLLMGLPLGNLWAQADYDYFQEDSVNAKDETRFTIESGFMTSMSGSGYYSYLSPRMETDVSERLTLHGGLFLERGSLFRNIYGEQGIGGPNSLSTSIMAGGTYQVSNRLAISGSAMMELNTNRPLNSGESSRLSGQNNQRYRLNFHYQVSDNVHFNAGFEYRQGRRNHLRRGLLGPDPNSMFPNRTGGRPIFGY